MSSHEPRETGMTLDEALHLVRLIIVEAGRNAPAQVYPADRRALERLVAEVSPPEGVPQDYVPASMVSTAGFIEVADLLREAQQRLVTLTEEHARLLLERDSAREQFDRHVQWASGELAKESKRADALEVQLASARQRSEALKYWYLCKDHQPDMWEAAEGQCPLCEANQMLARDEHIHAQYRVGLAPYLAKIEQLTEELQHDRDEHRKTQIAWAGAADARDANATRIKQLTAENQALTNELLKEAGMTFDPEAGCFEFDGRHYDTLPEVLTAYRRLSPSSTPEEPE